MRIPESELIINGDGSIFHLHLRPEEIADNIILVGDPGRVELFISYFEEVEFHRTAREFHSVTGRFNGKRVTVISTGIGTDNIDIVMTELDALANIDFKSREIKANPKTLNILRFGTCGSIQPDIPLGSFIFSYYSVGCDGLMNWYADRDNYSNLEMEEAFRKHTHWDKHLPDPYFIKASDVLIDKFKDCTIMGVTISASGFYGPQGRVVRIPLAMPNMIEDFESFRFGDFRITNFEMESSALAGMAAHLGHNAGTVCCVVANRHLKSSNPNYVSQIENFIRIIMERLTA